VPGKNLWGYLDSSDEDEGEREHDLMPALKSAQMAMNPGSIGRPRRTQRSGNNTALHRLRF
jgi:hypothetical protein